MKFARLVNGQFCDPTVADSLVELDTRYAPTYVTRLKNAGEWFAEITDQQYINLFTVLATTPKTFDGADWREYAYLILGTVALPAGTTDEKIAAGLARYGAILNAGRAAVPTDGLVAGAFDQYDRATNFRKDKVTIFLGVLNQTNPKIVEDNEFAAIIASWPEE